VDSFPASVSVDASVQTHDFIGMTVSLWSNRPRESGPRAASTTCRPAGFADARRWAVSSAGDRPPGRQLARASANCAVRSTSTGPTRQAWFRFVNDPKTRPTFPYLLASPSSD